MKLGTGGIAANTKLILHMNGPSYSTSFTDDSSSAQSLTNNRGVHHDPIEQKFGNTAGMFDGTNYLTIPDSEDWGFGTGDFTFDFWFKVILLIYRVEKKGILITDQPSAPRGERTVYRITPDGRKLILVHEEFESSYLRVG